MKIEEVKSASGITAWLVEDHSIPVVSANIGFRGGHARIGARPECNLESGSYNPSGRPIGEFNQHLQR